MKALEAQAKTRAATKVGSAERRTGQSELFETLHEMSGNEASTFLDAELVNARKTLVALAPDRSGPTLLYKDLWPQILARHVVRKTSVNKLAARLRKEGIVEFPSWEPRKQVPQPDYRSGLHVIPELAIKRRSSRALASPRHAFSKKRPQGRIKSAPVLMLHRTI